MARPQKRLRSIHFAASIILLACDRTLLSQAISTRNDVIAVRFDGANAKRMPRFACFSPIKNSRKILIVNNPEGSLFRILCFPANYFSCLAHTFLEVFQYPCTFDL